jgi:hypothetical protein
MADVHLFFFFFAGWYEGRLHGTEQQVQQDVKVKEHLCWLCYLGYRIDAGAPVE